MAKAVKPARTVSPETLTQCLTDAVTFASTILGVQPWDHQTEILRCTARTIVIKAGRRSGKSTAAAIKALWKAFCLSGATILIVSAGEDAAKRVLEECQRLASGSHLFRDFVTDEYKAEMRFANGSKILSVPKTEARIRGMGVDLLILDEAFQMGDEIWRAAEPATADRENAQIWICSTPGNSPLHFFNVKYRQGIDSPSEWIQSFHWPSSVSPRINKQVLKQIQEENDPWYFRREYLAEDIDDLEAVFPDSLIFGGVAYGARPISPEEARRHRERVQRWDGTEASEPIHDCVMGIDRGGSTDPTAIAIIGCVDDRNPTSDAASPNSKYVYAPVHLELHWQMGDEELTARVLELDSCYRCDVVIPENNGLAYHWSHDLPHRWMQARLPGQVVPVATTNETKRQTFSEIAGGLASGTLVIPEHVPHFDVLVREMRAIGHEQLPGGGIRLASRQGHDDVIMALSLAMRAVHPSWPRHDGGSAFTDFPHVPVAGGHAVPLAVTPRPEFTAWRHPSLR